jgi:hypothetical protein
MKQFLRAISLALVLTFVTVGTAGVVVTEVGCATAGLTPAQQIQLDAFNGLRTIRASVTTAVGVFNAGYQAGQFTEVQRTQLQALYSKYLAADTLAATALGSTTLTDPTQIVAQVTVLAGDILKFINVLKGVSP